MLHDSPPVVCRWAHVLFTLFVFVVFVILLVLCLVYRELPMFLDSPFLIFPSVFSDVY